MLRNQPLNTLNQNGSAWVENEYQRTINLANVNKLVNINTSNKMTVGSLDNQNLVLLNTDSSDSDPYIYFNSFITLKPNTTYSAYIICPDPIQYCGLTGYPYATSMVYNLSTTKISFTTNSTDLNFGFGFEGLQGYSYNVKIMIYEGSDTLPYIAYGGGKTTHIGDIEPVLLWENGNHGTAFYSQQVSLPAAKKYKYIYIEFGYGGDWQGQIFKFEFTDTGNIVLFGVDNSSNEIGSRLIKYWGSDGTFQFYDGYRDGSPNGYSCIPYKIYGSNN